MLKFQKCEIQTKLTNDVKGTLNQKMLHIAKIDGEK